MGRIRRAATALVAATMLTLGAGGVATAATATTATTGTPPPSTASAAALATSFGQAGLGCVDFAPAPKGSARAKFGINLGDWGTCSVNGQKIELHVYRDAVQLAKAYSTTKTVVCKYADARGSDTLAVATGANWLAGGGASTHTTATKIAKQVGAKDRTIHC